ncbi:MAG: hypothetical protein R3C17_02310 [Planctomycetaceae bacterium]
MFGECCLIGVAMVTALQKTGQLPTKQLGLQPDGKARFSMYRIVRRKSDA